MAIIKDYAAIADELRRVRVERQLERAEMAVSIGVLRVPALELLGNRTQDHGGPPEPEGKIDRHA